MKNLILIFAVFFSMISCNRDDENTNDNSIVGEWKLVKGKQNFVNILTDYSSKNIVYNFQTNNVLKISGGENLGYDNGDYTYSFIHQDASDNEMKTNLVEIQNLRWVFSASGSQMTLDLSHLDGPTLVFEKK